MQELQDRDTTASTNSKSITEYYVVSCVAESEKAIIYQVCKGYERTKENDKV